MAAKLYRKEWHWVGVYFVYTKRVYSALIHIKTKTVDKILFMSPQEI